MNIHRREGNLNNIVYDKWSDRRANRPSKTSSNIDRVFIFFGFEDKH